MKEGIRPSFGHDPEKMTGQLNEPSMLLSLVIAICIVLIIVSSMYIVFRPNQTNIPVNQLYHITWTVASSEVVGLWEGELVKLHTFTVERNISGCWYEIPNVVSINMSSGLMILKEDSQTYIGSCVEGVRVKVSTCNGTLVVILK